MGILYIKQPNGNQASGVQKVSDTNTDDMHKILHDIEAKSADDGYIYRGEPKCYPKVSSSLYRECVDKAGIDAKYFNIEVVQQEQLKIVKKDYSELTDDFEIMTEIQHAGGKTMLIDFTENYRVALFFACETEFSEDGRIRLLKRDRVPAEQIYKPTRQNTRARDQKSIFVKAPHQGYIDQNTMDPEVTIPAELKEPILDYLKKCQTISHSTIYNDIPGFITHQLRHSSAYIEFYKGLTNQDKGDNATDVAAKQGFYEEAIVNYDEAIKLNPQFADAYNTRGVVNGLLGHYDKALADFDKAIELNPQFAAAYMGRGMVHKGWGNIPLARQNLEIALRLPIAQGNINLAQLVQLVQRLLDDLPPP